VSADPDDLLDFCDDEVAPEASPSVPWRVLLVDDDAQVHLVSRLAFAKLEVDGRHVELLSASSGREARALLETHEDIAVGVFDVVMEEEDAGLALVEWARSFERLRCMRIILRTGQPGSAPEETVLRAWDINDYWPKTELTAHRMRTLLTGQLRSYRDLRVIERQRDDLGRVVTALGGLIGLQGLRDLLDGIVAQLRSAIAAEHAVLAIFDVGDPELQELSLLCCTGEASTGTLPESARRLLASSRESGRMAVEGANLALYCASAGPRGAAFWASGVSRLDAWTEHTLELFSRNALAVLSAQLETASRMAALEALAQGGSAGSGEP
jgi:CheY-like chemotaxis protein